MVSIIIPVYNSEKYIGSCIESVLNQTIKDFELILVNDGSTDNSYNICREYKKKDTRIKLINKKNGGVSLARFDGLKEALGEYVAFVDNDDVLMPEFLEMTIAYMEDDVDMVVCSAKNMFSENIVTFMQERSTKKNIGQELMVDEYTGLEAVDAKIDFSKYPISLPLWGKLYRTEFLKNLCMEQYAKVIPIIFFEDIFAMNIIYINARKVKFLSEILYIQRAVMNSQSRSGKLGQFYFDQIDSYALQYEIMKDKGVPKSVELCLDNYDRNLERVWYKVRHDKPIRNDSVQICSRVNKRYEEYYEIFKDMKCGKIRKFNMWLFRYHRKIWEFTLGYIFFEFVSRLKLIMVLRKIKKNV